MNEAMLARIDRSYQALLPAFSDLTAEQAAIGGACGFWSVKDVIVHLAWWENHLAEEIETGIEAESLDVEGINARVSEETQDISWDTAKRQLADAHARLIRAVATTAGVTDEQVKDDTWEHFQDHGDDIRAWRASIGS